MVGLPLNICLGSEQIQFGFIVIHSEQRPVSSVLINVCKLAPGREGRND
jgi:hypothetical protein